MPAASASAPATTANLGPAFDRVALALSLRCDVTAEPADEWSIEHMTEHAPGPGEGDGILVAARGAIGDRPLAITVHNQVPLTKGLGSSAAAYVAGTAAALRAVGDDASPDRVFRIAASLEGHEDQAAAAVYGGLVLIPAEGMPMRLPLHPSIRPVIAIPGTRLPTSEARAVIAESHDHEVVLRTISRVMALSTGLVTGDPELLAAAHGDEIHELPRAPLSPEVGELMEIARRAGALHAARSGAGPSVVALATAETAGRVSRAFEEAGASVLNAPIDTTGLV